MRRTALSMTVSDLMKERAMIARAFKRLCNLNALNLVCDRFFNRSYEQMDDLFWSLEQPFNLLTLVIRGECV